jgi:hypothetical protein
VRRDVGRIAEITFAQPPEPEPLPEPRVNLAKVPLDFGFAVTDGAFRVRKTTSGLTLTPLPDGPGFDVTLRLAEFGLRGAVASATAIADDGAETPVDFREDAGTVSFRVDGEAFAYEIGL